MEAQNRIENCSLPGGRSKTNLSVKGYFRLLHIFFVLATFALRVFINTRPWLRRWRKLADTELRHREGSLLRDKLLGLGPTFIKIGQTLATRADIMPVEYIQELSKLQDEVPPFPTEVARAIIEAETGARISDLFQSFDDCPIAAASLGQEPGEPDRVRHFSPPTRRAGSGPVSQSHQGCGLGGISRRIQGDHL